VQQRLTVQGDPDVPVASDRERSTAAAHGVRNERGRCLRRPIGVGGWHPERWRSRNRRRAAGEFDHRLRLPRRWTPRLGS